MSTLMFCICGYELMVRHQQWKGETVFEFLDSSGRMISACPACGTKWYTPADLEYCKPPENDGVLPIGGAPVEV